MEETMEWKGQPCLWSPFSNDGLFQKVLGVVDMVLIVF
jgi:hypothetical protein